MHYFERKLCTTDWALLFFLDFIDELKKFEEITMTLAVGIFTSLTGLTLFNMTDVHSTLQLPAILLLLIAEPVVNESTHVSFVSFISFQFIIDASTKKIVERSKKRCIISSYHNQRKRVDKPPNGGNSNTLLCCWLYLCYLFLAINATCIFVRKSTHDTYWLQMAYYTWEINGTFSATKIIVKLNWLYWFLVDQLF